MDEVKVTSRRRSDGSAGHARQKNRRWKAPRKGDLRKQAQAIVEKIDYLGSELKVIEVDGVSNAVQIRSKKPAKTASSKSSCAAETIYRWSGKPSALHISKGDFREVDARPERDSVSTRTTG